MPDSFDVSVIPSLPDIRQDEDEEDGQQCEEVDMDETKESVPNAYLPPDDDDKDEDAFQPVSRDSSPLPPAEIAPTPKKAYDYSVSLRSEPKVCCSKYGTLIC
jgi:hypothetical protein